MMIYTREIILYFINNLRVYSYLPKVLQRWDSMNKFNFKIFKLYTIFFP